MAGETYAIAVDGFGGDAGGFTIDVVCSKQNAEPIEEALMVFPESISFSTDSNGLHHS